MLAARSTAARLLASWPTRPARRVLGVAPPSHPRRPVRQKVAPAAPTPTSTRALFSAAAPLASTTAAGAAGAQQTSASLAHSLVRILAGTITGAASALFTPRGLLAAAAVGVTLGFIHWTPRSRPVERAYAKQVAETMLKVVTSPPFAPEGVLLTRPEAAAALASALDPAEGAPPGFFIIVTGPAGSGKTTLVRLALEELAKRRRAAAAAGGWEEDKGCVPKKPATATPPLPGGAAYVAAASHPRGNFGRDLAAAVGFSFEEGVRTLDLVSRLFVSSSAIQESANPTESLARAASAVEEAALDLQARGAGRPLLVVDGVDRLAWRDADALLDLVEYAKTWAESGLVTVALVVSDAPATMNLLKASPGFSRAAPPVMLAGPTVGEALDFLSRRLAAKGGGASPDELASLAAAIHDDWLLLQKAAALLLAGAGAADVRARLVAEAEPRFAAAGLLDRTPQGASGLALAHALAAEPSYPSILPPAVFHRLCPDRAAQDALLQPETKGARAASPFRYTPGVGLSFASAVDAAYVRSGVLDSVAWGGGGSGKEKGGVATAAAAAVGEGAGVGEVE